MTNFCPQIRPFTILGLVGFRACPVHNLRKAWGGNVGGLPFQPSYDPEPPVRDVPEDRPASPEGPDKAMSPATASLPASTPRTSVSRRPIRSTVTGDSGDTNSGP